MDGAPGGDGFITLLGSGFQPFATTIAVGGAILPNTQFTPLDYLGIGGGDGDFNEIEQIVIPRTLDGPLTITTAGGSAALQGYAYAAQPLARFTGIVAAARSGGGAAAGAAAAHT